MERRDVLKSSLGDLNGFYLAPTGSANLKLTDSKGRTFAIAHSAVIGEMVEMAKAKLNAELQAVESQFVF